MIYRCSILHCAREEMNISKSLSPQAGEAPYVICLICLPGSPLLTLPAILINEMQTCERAVREAELLLWSQWPKHNWDGRLGPGSNHGARSGPETGGKVERSHAGGTYLSSPSLPVWAFLIFSSVRFQLFIVASVLRCFPFCPLMEHVLHAFVECTLHCLHSVYSICHPRFSQQLCQGAKCHHI